MDNRINEIRRRMTDLREEMTRAEATMRDQIKRDLDSTEASLLLLKIRREMAALIGAWREAGGNDPLPTVRERLSPNSRLSKPKTPASR
jgi:hypothetical protein